MFHDHPGSPRLDNLARLWALERRASRARLEAERRELPFSERVALGLALGDLHVSETAAATGQRMLLWLAPGQPDALSHLRIGPGDPVRLWWEDPEEPTAVRAVVLRRRRGQLGVIVPDRDETLDLLAGSGFRLDRDDPQATFDRGDAAIARFREAKRDSEIGRLREVLLGRRSPGLRREGRPAIWRDAGLNEAQQQAVTLALETEDLALIHGPPGTGKTRTLAEVALHAVARDEKVLATAASNAAVDNLAERLIGAGLEVVRLGHPARVSPAVERHTLDALVEASPEHDLARGWMAEADRLRQRTANRSERGGMDRRTRREAYREARALVKDARRQLQQLQQVAIDRAQVVCCTAVGSASSILADRHFDLVLVDEASQATDPVVLIPLTRARRAVLAGDHRQLPPTVIDRQAAADGLATTFFEGLATEAEKRESRDSAAEETDLVARLAVQYRMHREIMAFPSASMYGGSLIADASVAEHRLESLAGVAADPLRPGPFVFIDTAGKSWDERRGAADPSTDNPEQAERVAAEMRRLLGRGLSPSQVGLITPYRAQARRLKALLEPELAGGLEIDTVDAFQGREKEAIVVDLVRSNPEGQIGFLADVRRMNVALTRARRFLLVIGDSATIGAQPFYADFLAAAEASGAWISAWNDEAEPFGL